MKDKLQGSYNLGCPGPQRFRVGDVVQHKLYGYRGVIVDVHGHYQGSDEWYDRVAKSRPIKEQPWYEVLVHDSSRMTYAAESNLDIDLTGMPVSHPMLRMFFREFHQGRYRIGGMTN